ncbi:MAG TPA: non-homologous end-joining DNA ligase [Pseudonocardiaceae bacterium]|nr:non-homologous end-joining DNA ligase [Pseudonocardiaceae bacterium]
MNLTSRFGLPEPVAPMLASAGELPSGPGWAFEFKWDGVRAIAAVAAEQVRLYSRNGRDITGGYPELAVLSGLVGGRPVLLDGEIVTLGEVGRPDFGLLQLRMHLRAPSPELVGRVPVSYYVFDLLDLDGRRLLPQRYQRRRELLTDLDLEGTSPRVRVPPYYTDVGGPQLLEVARRHGLEGVVGKRLGSRYEPGRRSPAWVKTALWTTQEVVVGGWTSGEGRRAGTLGALLLGAYDDQGRLRYLGDVGTGFTERMLNDLVARLAALEQPQSPFDEPVPREHARRAHWVRAQLVGEVEYRILTADRRLRHTTWRGLRTDKDPAQVTLI